MRDSYIQSVKNCKCYDDGNTLSEILPFINSLSEIEINNLISAYNENSQISISYGFNGKNARYNGDGLISHLNRWTNRNYRFSRSGQIIIPDDF